MKQILVVDDSRLHRTMCRSVLEAAGYAVREATDGPTALEAMGDNLPDLVILDWIMPSMSGVEVIRRVRADPFRQSIPILLLTIRDTRSDKVEALEQGADAYLAKPFYPEELLAEVEALLRRSFNYHPLTRLPAAPLIQQEVERALRQQAPVGFAYVDIDDFKTFNDYYGTPRGDDVIRFLAHIIQEAAAASAERVYVGHIGGDDFLFITASDNVEPVARRIIAAFERGIPDFYADEDRARGYIEIADRRSGVGVQRRPFMTLTIVALLHAPPPTGYSHVGRALATLKTEAKQTAGSTVLVRDGLT